MASKEFLRAVKNKRKFFNKAKKEKPGGSVCPELRDGRYIARVSAEVGVSPNKGVPFVRFPWTIIRGSHKKTSWSQSFFLENDNPEREQGAWNGLSKALQVLTGEDIDDLELTDITDIVDDINKQKPIVAIGVKNWTGSNGTKGLNVFFNELIEEEDDDDEEETLDEAEEEDEEEDQKNENEEEEEEEEENEDDEESEEESIEKGMEVKFGRGTYEVLTSNKRRETASLQSVKNPKLKKSNIAWDKLTVIEDD